MTRTFTEQELAYLSTQKLARLATVRADGSPQNNPVTFLIDGDAVVIGGYDLASTQKFRNLAANTSVSLVADDIASYDPWSVRGIEIRGEGVALVDVDPPEAWMSRTLIRIEPTRIISWGLDEVPAGSAQVAS